MDPRIRPAPLFLPFRRSDCLVADTDALADRLRASVAG